MLQVRKATLADKPAIFTFIKKAYQNRWQYKIPEWWEWEYVRDPFLEKDELPIWIATNEADQVVADWEILSKEQHVMYLLNAAEAESNKLWMEMYPEEGDGYTQAEWRAEYDRRNNKYNYTHVYYLLRKR